MSYDLIKAMKIRNQIDHLNVKAMALQAQMVAFQTYNSQSDGSHYPDTTFFAIEAELKEIADQMKSLLATM